MHQTINKKRCQKLEELEPGKTIELDWLELVHNTPNHKVRPAALKDLSYEDAGDETFDSGPKVKYNKIKSHVELNRRRQRKDGLATIDKATRSPGVGNENSQESEEYAISEMFNKYAKAARRYDSIAQMQSLDNIKAHRKKIQFEESTTIASPVRLFKNCFADSTE